MQGFTSIVPGDPLHNHIAMIWDCDVAPRAFALERILPRAGASLIINLADDETRAYRNDGSWTCVRKSGSVLVGPSTVSNVIDTTEQVFVCGVEFHAGGARHFFAEPLDQLRDTDTDLDDLDRTKASHIRDNLLAARCASERLEVIQRWLYARWNPSALPAVVSHALDIIDRSPLLQRVDELARSTGLSARRLGSLFAEHVGMSPKRYVRLQRFRAVTAMAQAQATINWSAVAADCGFHDQAHLIREFREFSGLTPGLWMASRTAHESHQAIDTDRPLA